MNAEHKQALIGLCKIEIMRWKAVAESNPNMVYMVELMETAMAALTAPAIKVPDILSEDFHDYGGHFEYSLYDRALKVSIHEAGHEVQE